MFLCQYFQLIQKEAVDLIQRLLRERPKDRIRIPDIMKHKWFRRFDLSFDYHVIEHEQLNAELIEYIRKNSFHDPFEKPNEDRVSALEAEIKEEKAQFEKERRKKLRLLKEIDKVHLDSQGECASPTSPVRRRTSKSLEIPGQVEKEGQTRSKLQDQEASDPSKTLHRHKTEKDKPQEMRIIYKDSVAVIQKDEEGLEQTLISNINRLAGISFSDTDQGLTSSGTDFRKSQLIIDEIDKEYDKFEAMPIDVGVQTTPEIVCFQLSS
jgi:serine/threonine protein kinase